MVQDHPERLVPKDIKDQERKWHWGAITLHSIYIFLGVTSVVSSVVVATFTEQLDPILTKIFAGTSAVSVALIETTGVGRNGNGFRKAQRQLAIANIRFREGVITMEQLTRAFEEADGMIGDVEIKIRDGG